MLGLFGLSSDSGTGRGGQGGKSLTHSRSLDLEHAQVHVAALVAPLSAEHLVPGLTRGLLEVGVDACPERHKSATGRLSISTGHPSRRRVSAVSFIAVTAAAAASGSKLAPPTYGWPPPPSLSHSFAMSCTRSSGGSQGL